jgi:hypothetical protein
VTDLKRVVSEELPSYEWKVNVSSSATGGHMRSTKNPGRIAGFLYLVLVIAAPFRLIYIPGTLFVHGNATATANNIAAHELLSVSASSATCSAGRSFLIFLVLALYRLLKAVDQNHAVVMVILGGVMPATIDFLNVLNDVAALMFVRGANFLSVFDKPQRDALAMLFLRLHHQEIVAAEILWGLWLFPLAVLVYRSRFLPRFLGVWLIINGFEARPERPECARHNTLIMVQHNNLV